MKPIAAVALVALALLAAPSASAMPVSEFLEEAEDIPMNPTALLRADARRLMREVNTAFETIRDERRADIDAGRQPAFCVESGTRVSLNPQELLARLRAIPPSRRHISVTQAMREWMIERHPC